MAFGTYLSLALLVAFTFSSFGPTLAARKLLQTTSLPSDSTSSSLPFLPFLPYLPKLPIPFLSNAPVDNPTAQPSVPGLPQATISVTTKGSLTSPATLPTTTPSIPFLSTPTATTTSP
ncbi:uncharacterized protein LOC133784863 [Humulus lupulus]|uniref:uncharacterized protein LOC133784863 n=1 Tax=Humulus lupulus TaxID=3486 RepID=UPI002B4183BB|nr:uncharacterized protein LOC133784863 [Humulus lupulus]